MSRVGLSFRFLFVASLVAVFGFGTHAWSQDSKPETGGQSPAGSSQGQDSQQNVDPLKRPVSEKQRRENAKALRHELGKVYGDWLNKDVVWIIRPGSC